MTKEEREALIQKLAADNWETRVDLNNRRAQHLDEWQLPQEESASSYQPNQSRIAAGPIMNAGEQQVRSSYQQQRPIPILDPATQALWDSWCKAMIVSEWNAWMREHMLEIFYQSAEILGDELGKSDKATDDAIGKLREAGDQLRKEFKDEIVKLRKENAKLRKEMALQSGNVTQLPAYRSNKS